MLRKQVLYLWPILCFILLILLCSVFLFQLGSHFTQGYFLIPPFKLETPTTLETFHSQVKNISMSYPKGWATSDFYNGNRGDKEIIAFIRPQPFLIILTLQSYIQLCLAHHLKMLLSGAKAGSSLNHMRLSPLTKLTLTVCLHC